jgi:hypothetical protein
VTDGHLTPINCKRCGKSATFEFLYQDKRMCVMCYMEAVTGKSTEALAQADAELIALEEAAEKAPPPGPENK